MDENTKKVMFSSKKEEWATPLKFYQELDNEFHFTLDPCADAKNHKCEKYYTVDDDGLSKSWEGERVFCNPPYGRIKTTLWIEKCAREAKRAEVVVALLPSRTDTKAFHEFIYNKPGVEIRFVKGRLKFDDGKVPAPFPSMVVVFRNLEGCSNEKM